MDDGRKVVTLDDIERRHNLNYIERIQVWHRQLMLLASSGLTLLVSLQGSYVPKNPIGLWLLQVCWLGLGICIAAGVLVMFGEAQGHRDAQIRLAQHRHAHGDEATKHWILATGGSSPERGIFYHGRQLFLGSFLLALVALCGFAVLNAGGVTE